MDRSKKIIIVIAILSLPLFFINGPGYNSPRSYKHGWDLEHIVIFFFWAILLLTNWKKISKMKLFPQSLSILAIAFIIGLIIELLQGQIDRTASTRDLLNDPLGSLIAIAFISPSLKSISKVIKIFFQFIIVLSFLYSLYPLSTSLIDEAIASKDFPLLSNLENPFEVTRWEGHTGFKKTSKIAKDGSIY